MYKSIITAVVILLSSMAFSQGTLEINVTGFSSEKGQLVILLFKKGQSFGHNEKPLRKILSSEISGDKCTVTIDDLAKGEYAFTVFHDEDKNGELLTRWMGMPKEGIGKSGSQKSRPSYENSKFDYSGESKIINVKLKYL